MNASRRNRGYRASEMRNRRNQFDRNNSLNGERRGLTPETKSFAYGVGVGILAMMLFPQMKDGLKPMAVGAMKGVSGLAEKVQEAITQVKEGFEDIVAEAKFENFKQALDNEITKDPGQ